MPEIASFKVELGIRAFRLWKFRGGRRATLVLEGHLSDLPKAMDLMAQSVGSEICLQFAVRPKPDAETTRDDA